MQEYIPVLLSFTQQYNGADVVTLPLNTELDDP